MSGREPHHGLRVAVTAEVGAEGLLRIRSLLEEAFAERPEGAFGPDDWTHCLGGVHVWAQDDDGAVLAHASVVQRRLLHGDRVLRCGYVEAVAVRADRRRSGLGTTVMEVVDDLIRGGHDLGALGATEAGERLYRSRGWQPWRRFLGHLTPQGIEPDPAELGTILVLPVAGVTLDLDGSLVCGPREGDPW